jgi:hypothetical protein
MSSVPRFIGLWVGLTAVILCYAYADLVLNPWLMRESGVALQPDWSRIGELWHWGGRLLREQPAVLLGNAAALGGLLALGLDALVGRVRRRRPQQVVLRAEDDGPSSFDAIEP